MKQKQKTPKKVHKYILGETERLVVVTRRQTKNMSSKNSGAAAASAVNNNGKLPMEENEEEEIWKAAVSRFQTREEEIERKKMTVKEKIQQRLGFAEEATRSLTQTLEVSPISY